MKRILFVFTFVMSFILFVGCSSYANKLPDNPFDKPSDCDLEFWIGENVENVDFSAYDEIYGWFGAREYLGKGYVSQIDEDGVQIFPLEYVSYIVSAYPDYADGGSCITGIKIFTSDFTVYGISINSSVEEFDNVFESMGYTVSSVGSSGMTHTAEKDGVTFTFDAKNSIRINVSISNREGIVF